MSFGIDLSSVQFYAPFFFFSEKKSSRLLHALGAGDFYFGGGMSENLCLYELVFIYLKISEQF